MGRGSRTPGGAVTSSCAGRARGAPPPWLCCGIWRRSGFPGAPRVVGSGFADDGRETVSYIPGESPQPYRWSDDAVAEVGRLLAALHRATASFTPPADAVWQEWFGRELGGADPVISHCDLGPWNIIAREGRPVAFVDWEFAGPVDALWDLAHTAWLNAQLHDDDVAETNELGGPEDRARQLRLLVDGYGLDRDRAGRAWWRR